MQPRNTIGTRIRELRNERGLRLEDVAEAAGVSASHLSRIERGLTAPSFMVATRIAAALGMLPGALASMQREQSATDNELVAVLMAQGLAPMLALEITGNISTPARHALLVALSDVL